MNKNNLPEWLLREPEGERLQFLDFLRTQQNFKGSKEHLFHFLQGSDHWNRWLEIKLKKDNNHKTNLMQLDLCSVDAMHYSKLAKVDYEGNYENIILCHYNFENVDLSSSWLIGVDFTGAFLKKTLFVKCELNYSNFYNVKCYDSIFRESNLSRTNFENAKIVNTDFCQADMTYSNLSSCVFKENRMESKIYSGFRSCNFEKANLMSSEFHKMNMSDCSFKNILLFKTSFYNCNLEESTFEDIDNSDIVFRECNLSLARFKNCELYDIDFRGSILGNVDNHGMEKSTSFSNCKLLKMSIDKHTQCLNTFFDNTPISLHPSCNEQDAIDSLSQGIVNNIQFTDTVFGRKVRDQAWLNDWKNSIQKLKKTNKWKFFFLNIWEKIWKHTSDYGRDFWKWLKWSFYISFIFFGGLISMFPEGFKFVNYENDIYSFFNPFYYSIVTFTTLGFGDVIPIKWWSELMIVFEVFIGYIMLGGLISILANKLARRND